MLRTRATSSILELLASSVRSHATAKVYVKGMFWRPSTAAVGSRNFGLTTAGNSPDRSEEGATKSSEELVTEMIRNVPKYQSPLPLQKGGLSVIHNPIYNKGSGFGFAERDRLGLRGLVPPRMLRMNEQVEKVYSRFLEEEDPLRKNMYLMSLHDRNEVLFYRLIIDHIEEVAPIIYTPTVGHVCQKFADRFKRPRGMYFSKYDASHFGAMLHNWPIDDVEVIVVTDGSRILGLGDLGLNGMGIPIGKLALYVAAGGIDPARTLPCILDVGTNNENLLKDPHYLGIQEKRITGEEYFAIIDEFCRAVRARWPKALLQFEDFNSSVAADILAVYRNKQLCFNDDIQGTGAVVLAGVLSACRQTGTNFTEQRIVVLGAGSAGIGVASSLMAGMIQSGVSPQEAASKFWVFDQHGLITDKREKLGGGQEEFARTDYPDKMSLLDLVKEVKPTCILGLSASKGAFTEPVIREIAKHTHRPIVFPLSNPTHVSECTAADAYRWTDGRCVFASGSPFGSVEFGGKTYSTSQCNNMFIFPGVGLGAILCEASSVTERMFFAAAKALADCPTDEDIERGLVFPRVANIRDVSVRVATAVIRVAIDTNVARLKPEVRRGSTLEDWVRSRMYEPKYRPFVIM